MHFLFTGKAPLSPSLRPFQDPVEKSPPQRTPACLLWADLGTACSVFPSQFSVHSSMPVPPPHTVVCTARGPSSLSADCVLTVCWVTCHALCMTSFTSRYIPWELNSVITPSCPPAERDLDRLSHLLKVTQSVSGRSRLQTESVSTLGPAFI